MEWPLVCLKRVSKYGPQYGANARAVSETGTKPRYIRITDITSDGRLRSDEIAEADLEDYSSYLLQDGDLLFARSGNTVGKTYRYSKSHGLCVFAGYLIRFQINTEIAEPNYVFYFTRSQPYANWVIRKRRVAGQPNINGTEYSSLLLPLPPLSEQRRIVEILDVADALRRRRAEADTKFVRIIPTLFHKMFGDLISNSCGWKKEPITKLCVKEDGIKCGPFGTQLSNKEYRKDGVPLWGIKHVNAGFAIETTEFISQEKADYLESYSILPGDIIMTRKGTVGNCSVYPENYPTGIMHSDLLRIRVDRKKALPCFLAFQLQLSPTVINQISTISGGAVMAGINVSRLKSLLVHVPPLEKQVQFEQNVHEIQRLLERLRNTKVRISSLFDVLLHRAFTGDLTAKWREDHMTEILSEMEEQAKMLNISDHLGT